MNLLVSTKSYQLAQLKSFTSKITLLILLIITMVFIAKIPKAHAQTLPVYIDERGDTISYDLPIPLDSLCIKDEIIIRFKENALHLNQLCMPTMTAKEQFMSKKFPVQDVIADTNLLAAIQSYGGDTLTRITAADPCHDTLSITRYGDTVKVQNYLWMKLHLNNDTSIVNACIDLMVFYRQYLELAEPNYCGEFNALPDDDYYDSHQSGLHPKWINVEFAWGFETGDYRVKVGVIDDGIDYMHSDLGASKPIDFLNGKNKKVRGGWNYDSHTDNILGGSTHGTPVAGIIGGLTNGTAPGYINTGIAGIVWGWYDGIEWTESNIGCPLYGFKIDVEPEDSATVENVIGAIYDAASEYPNDNENQIKSGFGVHVLNCSWGYDDKFKYLGNLRRAINYAYEQGVSVVASRGNDLLFQDNWYPANFNGSWVTNVSSHSNDLPTKKIIKFPYGKGLDILAPGSSAHTYSTKYMGDFDFFKHTSSSAAYVSGAISLLRSENFDTPFELNGKQPEPQDYENMLKAAANDLTYDGDYDEPDAFEGYDEASGWGQLKVDKVFKMIHEDGYRLKHIDVEYDYLSFNPFSGLLFDFTFYNEGGYDLSKYNGLIPGEPYKARMRAVTASHTLDQGWERTAQYPLFVWGRHGNRLSTENSEFIGGLSKATLNFMTPYTEITSGEKGNLLVPGIFHNNSLTVHLKTYQFEVYTDDGQTKITNLPKDEDIAMHFTVFGKSNNTSVEGKLLDQPASIFIYPNPTQDQISIKFHSEAPCSPKLKIINSLGLPILEKEIGYVSSGIIQKNIDVSNLRNGTYFIELRCGETVKRDKFVINK